MKINKLKFSTNFQWLLVLPLYIFVVVLGFWTYTFDDHSSLAIKIDNQKQKISQQLATTRELITKILAPTPTIAAVIEPAEPTPTPTPTSVDLSPTPTPIKTPEIYLPIGFYYEKDNSLYYYYSDTQTSKETKVSPESDIVTDIDFVGENTFAYITSPVSPSSNGADFAKTVGSYEVYLGTREKTTDKISLEKIYSLGYTYRQDGYDSKIFSLKFSPDGKKLVITTFDAIWMYDLDKKTLESILYSPSDPRDNEAWFYGYSGVSFSPNGEKLLVNKAYLEGGSQIYIDLGTKNVIDFKNENYSSGTSYSGWFDNTSLVGEVWDRGIGTSQIFLFNPQDSSKKIIKNMPNGKESTGTHNNTVYFRESNTNSQEIYSSFDLATGKTTALKFDVSPVKDIVGRDGNTYLLFRGRTPTNSYGLFITDQNPDSESKRYLLIDNN